MSCSPFRISKRSSPRCLGDLDAGSKLKLRRPQSKTMSNGYETWEMESSTSLKQSSSEQSSSQLSPLESGCGFSEANSKRCHGEAVDVRES